MERLEPSRATERECKSTPDPLIKDSVPREWSDSELIEFLDDFSLAFGPPFVLDKRLLTPFEIESLTQQSDGPPDRTDRGELPAQVAGRRRKRRPKPYRPHRWNEMISFRPPSPSEDPVAGED